MNVGYHLAALKNRVLLVDMDPQASLTNFMGFEPLDFEVESTVYHALVKEEPLPIQTNVFGMDLAPANIYMSRAEMELVAVMQREQRLAQSLEPIQDEYDFVLIDCPPSLGILSILGLVAATHVLVPIQTEYKAMRGTELLMQTVTDIRRKANKGLQFAGIIPTMYDSRVSQHTRSLEAIQTQLAQISPIMPAIPRATDFTNASEEHQPLAMYNRRHPAVKILKKIAQHLHRNVGGKE